ncbi:hypothetical protein BLA60_35390 [Actinophytocola xinjiangensis]|uniref:Beta-lactamase-related domain-containing protein n=1 Tax=Actinophytocola xinjiangensis TaxID=485602 RepID=A0A7Z0WEM8_9PSEU|nr:serine hydrolase domain-containing protein [Actinophytocola xinjiangensis]OLF05567.1 hypothetical protein BLA60_35390 [Actinophytocola xinjiangensis]
MRARKTRMVAGSVALAIGLGCVSAGTVAAQPRDDHADTQALIDGYVDRGVPGAMVFARDGRRSWSVTSGTSRLGVDDPIRPWDRVRVASNTKMFVSVVTLQLVGEGKIELDAPIERYLPGLVSGNGYDGNRITVRQLLQHTSGMDDYVADLMADPVGNNRPWAPEELVALGLSHPPLFEPGTDWAYSNTGYVVLGLLIEKITGNSTRDEIDDRIVKPHWLFQTELPRSGDVHISGPHAHGYFAFPGQPVMDITDFEPSMASFSGSMVSSGLDMTRFVRALVEGRVLAPELLKEMRATIPVEYGEYGLGLVSYTTPCGEQAWGHSGNIVGYDSFTAATEDGRSAFAVANGRDTAGDAVDLREAVNSALC